MDKLTCPTCDNRLRPLEDSAPGSTAVCPYCGELVRTFLGVRIYTDEEAEEKAHPEVLERLRGIQVQVRTCEHGQPLEVKKLDGAHAIVTECEDCLHT